MKSAGKESRVENLAPLAIENGSPLSQLVVLYVGMK